MDPSGSPNHGHLIGTAKGVWQSQPQLHRSFWCAAPAFFLALFLVIPWAAWAHWPCNSRLQLLSVVSVPPPLYSCSSGSVSSLLWHWPPPGNPTKLPLDQALLYACSLLRFNILWLGREYMNRHCDWDATFSSMQSSHSCAPPLDFLSADLAWGKRRFTEGVPLLGHYVSSSADIPFRDRHNNHPTVRKHFEAVEGKLVCERGREVFSHSFSLLLSLLHPRSHY
jgi:hypothetical protein